MPVEASSEATTTGQRIGLLLGPILFCVTLFLDLDPSNPGVTGMAAVAVLMATWWITDAIPLSATALLPLVLYPLLGIMKTRECAPIYFNSTIFLFIGGFMIALTMEKWTLHKRIALWIIRRIGGGPSRIILGFMVAAAFLSMWISNTATAIMMVPIAMAIILQLEERFGWSACHPFTVALMLGIAYACSLGGMATLVGTPPNLSFARIFEITFPNAEPIAFGQWLLMAFPITLVLLTVVWLLLTRVFFRFGKTFEVDREVVKREYAALGGISFEERAVLTVFAATAFGWVFRKDLVLGLVTIPGWSRLLPHAGPDRRRHGRHRYGDDPVFHPDAQPERRQPHADGRRRVRQDSLAHRASVRRRFRPGSGLPGHRSFRADRNPVRGPRRSTALRHDRVGLRRHYLPHRTDLEYRDNRDDPADPRLGRGRHESQPAAA